ncbi:MAG: energy-coupling factor transporter transmembrane component T [Oscillospiraceae bacterium]|nr:energy-coupling factor transporter transmembrane component T [Oscillospiraceae bacterium]
MENNKLKSFSTLHPFVLIVYFVTILVVSMFGTNPVLLFLSLVGGMMFFGMMNSKKAFFNDLAFYIPMFFLIAIINPLFSHNGVTPLFFMNGNPVTLEAILYGGNIALMLMAVVYWCKCYSEIMTTDKFLYLFGKVIPKLSLVLSMALRFIPLFREKHREFRMVQGASGLYDQKGFVNKIICELKVFSALVTWSLENSVDTASSMKARGYGLKGRTHFSMYKFRKRDGIFLAVNLLLFSVVAFGMGIGFVDFSFYPLVTEIKTGAVQIVVYISLGVMSLLPFITELWEVIVWKYSMSKI